MPHVVTQSCVGDGSCVHSCPVNCIQPTPDDPAFELAEMLHIDPTACVDCGACVSACPVDAIKPHNRLLPGEAPFELINARYHERARAPRPPLAPVRARLRVRDRGDSLRVAVVGSGPAAMYAAEEVLTIPGAAVDVYERERAPYGLVQAGVAPDHRRTRRVTRQLDRIRAHPGLSLHLGVEIGRDLTHEDLLRTHHAVIYAVGAAEDRRLGIPGAERVLTATDVVAWYNGRRSHAPVLDTARAVVIGNGNVALDIARILVADPVTLADSEIAPAALQALRASRIEEVVVAARRGPEHSAFTLPELVGLTATTPVALDAGGPLPSGDDAKLDILRSLERSGAQGRRVTLRYRAEPVAVTATGVDLAGGEHLPAGLVISAIGYRGLPVPGLPFDAATGTVPNVDGRVGPGTYVAGWIKRGPSGFIGTNKACAQDTVAALVADYNEGLLERRPASAQARVAVRR
jgi:ferredoxin--NADP+ reductase